MTTVNVAVEKVEVGTYKVTGDREVFVTTCRSSDGPWYDYMVVRTLEETKEVEIGDTLHYEENHDSYPDDRAKDMAIAWAKEYVTMKVGAIVANCIFCDEKTEMKLTKKHTATLTGDLWDALRSLAATVACNTCQNENEGK